MEHLVFYRKYRPGSFADITGQAPIVKTLMNSLLQGMTSHAYLFCGPRGVGKTTTARVLAKALNCLDPKKAEPCNECINCKAINEGRAIDLLEVDAASNTGVDNIRELIEGIKFAPTLLKYKIFIIDECHQLSKGAANALLKTLEEPPGHAVFILATTEYHKLLPTISSRCQRFDFRKISAADIAAKLEKIAKKEGYKIENEALELIAQNAQGALRDGEVLFNQIAIMGKKEEIKAQDIRHLLNLVDVKIVSQLFDFLLQKDVKSAIDFLNNMLNDGYDPQEIAKDMIDYLRQSLLLKIDKKLFDPIMTNFTKEDLLKLAEQIEMIEQKDIIRALDLFLDAKNKIKYSPIPQLPIELAIIEFANPQTSANESSVIEGMKG